MDISERKELVLRNTEEIIQEDELEEILEEKDEPRAYIGNETSGPVHLGHWIQIRKMKDFQKAGFQPVVLFADLHTFLNKKGEEEWIQEMVDYWKATFEACGLDAEYVKGREFQEETEYFHDLLRMTQQTTVNRGERSMGEVASEQENIYTSQIVYPLMQALDIVHLDLDLATAGIDQRKIHMMAREKLPQIGYEKPTCLHWPLLSSLAGEGGKMSSSKKGTMFPLHADPERIRETLKDAYCPQGEIEGNPMIEIAKFFIFGADRELEIRREEKYGGNVHYSNFEDLKNDFRDKDLHPEDLKEAIAEKVVKRFKPVRDRFKKEPELLDPLEEAGYEKPDYLR